MKAYLITTAAVFGLITLAHIARIVTDWPHLATNLVYILLTIAAAGLCFWAVRLLRRRDA